MVKNMNEHYIKENEYIEDPLPEVPERIRKTVSPEVWEDSILFHATVKEMVDMGLKPPTYMEWMRYWSFLDIDAARKPKGGEKK